MKKILVTGGAGFIGSHLVERLVKDGNHVVVLDNLLRGNKIPREILKEVEFYAEDVRDEDAVFAAADGVDQIIHFAAVLGVDVVADNPVETMEVETIGMMNLVKAGLINNIEKMVYASTSGVYGHASIEEKVTENIAVDPQTSYAIAKRYNEIYLQGIYQERGLPSACLRFFNVYGPRQDSRMVIPRFVEQALQGEPITVYDDGKQTRDFTWIGDTVEAVLQVMEKSQGCEIFNIANEDELCIADLADHVKRLTRSNSEIVNVPSPLKRKDFEIRRRYGSSQKLFDFTGFRPATNLEDGLNNILEGIS